MEHRRTIIFVTTVATFLTFLDVTIVNVAFPSIRADFDDATLSTLSWVLNAYNVVFAALLVIGGRISDLVGRRRVFLSGLGLFTVASAVCALAPSAEVLIAARVVQAIAGAALIPSALALLLGVFPPERRASAIGIWGAAGGVAAAVGPSIGGLLVSASSWRLVFAINVPIGILGLVLGARALHESREENARVPDVVGSVLLAGSMGLLALALVEGNDWGWTSARILGSFAASAVLGVLLVLRSRTHPAPAIDLELFGRPRFSLASVATLLFATAFYGMVFASALFLTSVWHYSVLRTGFAISPGPMAAAAISVPAGRMADRIGTRAVSLFGIALFTLGFVLLTTRVGSTPAYLTEWLPSFVVVGLGVGCAFPMLSATAIQAADPRRFGIASATIASARQIGAVLGVALVVVMLTGDLDPLTAFHHVWLGAAILGGAAGAAVLTLGPAQRVPDAVELGEAA